jgi:hypothetical protein
MANINENKYDSVYIFTSDNNTFALDSVDGVVHTSKLNISKNVIDNGSQIVDHSYFNQNEFNLNGVITDYPILFDPVDSINYDSSQTPRSQVAHDILYQYYLNRELFTLVTNLRVYENMVIVNFQVNEIMNYIELSIKFEEVRFKQDEYYISIENLREDVKDALSEQRNKGKKSVNKK